MSHKHVRLIIFMQLMGAGSSYNSCLNQRHALNSLIIHKHNSRHLYRKMKTTSVPFASSFFTAQNRDRSPPPPPPVPRSLGIVHYFISSLLDIYVIQFAVFCQQIFLKNIFGSCSLGEGSSGKRWFSYI